MTKIDYLFHKCFAKVDHNVANTQQLLPIKAM